MQLSSCHMEPCVLHVYLTHGVPHRPWSLCGIWSAKAPQFFQFVFTPSAGGGRVLPILLTVFRVAPGFCLMLLGRGLASCCKAEHMELSYDLLKSDLTGPLLTPPPLWIPKWSGLSVEPWWLIPRVVLFTCEEPAALQRRAGSGALVIHLKNEC